MTLDKPKMSIGKRKSKGNKRLLLCFSSKKLMRHCVDSDKKRSWSRLSRKILTLELMRKLRGKKLLED
jgi:hypothetical protein